MSKLDNTKIINNETMRRLLRDVKQIIKHPLTDNGIYYSHDETDFTKGYAMIVGPSETPYFGGYYFFDFKYPYDYPYSPPTVTFMTNDGVTRFNPNLYICGKVCVSILNTWNGDKWSACQTISSVLLTLCSILNATPLINEPGLNINNPDFNPYQKSIEYKNIDFSVCDILYKGYNNSLEEKFQIFYPFMRECFIANYDKLIEFVETKTQENTEEILFVKIYNMQTNVNYSLLKNKLIELKQHITQV